MHESNDPGSIKHRKKIHLTTGMGHGREIQVAFFPLQQ